MSILLFGEIVWDDITERGGSGKPEHLGGAPLNVAAHCVKLGTRAEMCSGLGDDTLGRSALAQVRDLGVGTSLVGWTDKETCLIQVRFNAAGEPSYQIPQEVSWDHITLDDSKCELVKNCSCLYYGTLAMRSKESRMTLERIISVGRFERIFCDINLRQPFYDASTIESCLKICDTAKMNQHELWEIGRIFSYKANDLEAQMRWTLERFALKQLVVTLGEQGAACLDAEDFGYVPGLSVQVSDTVGAGDGFSAGLLVCLERGFPLEKACALGNKLGAFVAGKTGSIPDYTKKEFEDWREYNV